MEIQNVQNRIYEIRSQRVMLNFDLAALYDVETHVLKQAVKRNIGRFPADFMFELTEIEMKKMVSQNVIPSKSKFGGARPMAFTEQRVAMFSEVLKSNVATEVNIAIMRAFVVLRQYALSHKDLTDKLKKIKRKYNKQFKDVYEALNYLLTKDKGEKEQRGRVRIGFKTNN
ncbi:DNA-binding protein [Niabella ginsenosidivorans]|uniref:DNA-binding protein n=1 Tax=Niabella ginsenosidivorans TaxID=1176587 RepID=A0A1A9I5T0_9BACT|nr:ORF6N domain-containing protein [Niabella ginsenosidivorans]ANH82903.1 DNA-binding protein [Niabella ginsenosidivorans]